MSCLVKMGEKKSAKFEAEGEEGLEREGEFEEAEEGGGVEVLLV